MRWTEGGEKWICNICNYNNETKPYYFNKLDKANNRVDQYTKPDLYSGTYEYLANAQYVNQNRKPVIPCYIIMIDVSLVSIQHGYLSAVIESIKDVINNDQLKFTETTKVI